MTIFMQLVCPVGTGTYWTAWVDPAHQGIGVGRSKKEALGDLMLMLANKEAGEVEIRVQPATDDRPRAKGGAR